MNEHPDEQVAEAARDPNAGGIPLTCGHSEPQTCGPCKPNDVGIQPWTWPEWLTCVAIAKDDNGEWYGWDCVPIMEREIAGGLWIVPPDGGEFIQLTDWFDTSGFPDVPWNESLRVNPNHKAF